jgi:hypothetical protein
MSALLDRADVERASRIVEVSNQGSTTDDSPLVIDLPNGPIQGQHWTCLQVCAMGFFAARVPAQNPLPSLGIYLVPQNSPVETLADASNATFGVNPQARTGIALPYVLTVAPAGTRKFFTCYAQLFADLIVPGGWTLRFIANVSPATGTPGPGANSEAWLRAHVIKEFNAAPVTRPRV